MSDNIQKLRQLIEKAENILISTHNGPDPDAWSSLSIVRIALEKFMDRKNVTVKVLGSANDGPTGQRYQKLNNTTIINGEEEIDLTGFDLILMTDAQEVERCFPRYKNLEENVKLVSIDHHEQNPKSVAKLELNFNERRSSAAEEVYRVFRGLLGKEFAEDRIVAELAQRGIVSDTYRFLYPNTQSETYELMKELTEVSRLDMEEYMQELSAIPIGAIKAMEILLHSFKSEENMAYICISAQEVIDAGLTEKDRDEAGQFLINAVIRDIIGIDWGFAMRESLTTPGKWKLSFRANNGTREVVEIAKLLNGGGHKYAAGGEVYAESKEEAINKVMEAVKKTNPRN